MTMIAIALLAVPMAGVWMLLTSSLTPDSFLVGWLVGFAILFTMRVQNAAIRPRRLPSQILALAVYSVTLARDIFLSSIDVARRVLDPDLPLNAGIIAVPTQCPEESEVCAAFSAHGITITPGELVVDFEGAHTMYVHCLDVEASGKTAHEAQARRMAMLRRIQGKEA
jgi:multicomponent Na+:H+ antiporter subunit E